MMLHLKKALSAMVVLLFLATSVWAVTKPVSSDNRCVVVVKDSRGDAVKYAKVSTEVSGGWSCIGGREFETDSQGKVTLLWVEGCKLTKVYVKGKGYKVDYQNGNTYTLTIE